MLNRNIFLVFDVGVNILFLDCTETLLIDEVVVAVAPPSPSLCSLLS